MASQHLVRTPGQLGAALRTRRRGLGLSQKELSGRISLRQATVSAVESGASDTRLSTIMDLLNALNLELVVRPREAHTDEDLEKLF